MNTLFAYRYDITAGTIVFCLFTALVLFASLLEAIGETQRKCDQETKEEGNGR